MLHKQCVFGVVDKSSITFLCKSVSTILALVRMIVVSVINEFDFVSKFFATKITNKRGEMEGISVPASNGK